MSTGVIILASVIAVMIFCLVWYWGYSMGQKDAYMDCFEKEEFYDWMMEVKRKENWE